MMQVSSDGMLLGDYMLQPRSDALYLCDKTGAGCSALATRS